MRQKHFILRALLLGAVSLTMQAQSTNTSQASTPTKKDSAPAKQQQQSEGERVFTQNCSRCHNAPDSFSPHISGTIVMHMRVRASLSEHDVRELLHFLNP